MSEIANPAKRRRIASTGNRYLISVHDSKWIVEYTRINMNSIEIGLTMKSNNFLALFINDRTKPYSMNGKKMPKLATRDKLLIKLLSDEGQNMK
jgi:hypothetical protein